MIRKAVAQFNCGGSTLYLEPFRDTDAVKFYCIIDKNLSSQFPFTLLATFHQRNEKILQSRYNSPTKCTVHFTGKYSDDKHSILIVVHCLHSKVVYTHFLSNSKPSYYGSVVTEVNVSRF